LHLVGKFNRCKKWGKKLNFRSSAGSKKVWRDNGRTVPTVISPRT
jgi:hypothetical protein